MRRDRKPGVEAMESRQLLSSSALLAFTRGPSIDGAAAALSAAISGGTGGSGHGSSGGSGGGSTQPSPTPTEGAGTPSTMELARERFHAVFTGPYYVGPGRFSDQKQITYIRGVGGSNFFLHGNLNMAIITPVDPTAATTSEAVLADKNLNGGGILGLALTPTTTPPTVASNGLVTDFSFTGDQNIYSGIFFVENSAGTVRVVYHPTGAGGSRSPGAVQKGIASVEFTGLVYTSGLTNPLRNTDLVAHQARVFPRTSKLP